jgi:hypothetical protein
VEVVDAPSAYDALDRSAGAAGSYDRLAQFTGDARWTVRHVRAATSGRLCAAVPVFTQRGRTWADPMYDPGKWGLPGGLGDLGPGDAMLMGGCADLRSGLHVSAGAARSHLLRTVLCAAAGLAAAQDRALVLPYFYTDARDDLSAASDGLVVWATLAREAAFEDVLAADRDQRLGSRVRGVLRRDRRLIEAARLDGEVLPWSGAGPDVAELIAAHNARKGKPDHPEFVRMRHAQWAECPSVEVVVFAVRSASARGVLTALVWRNELELYEIGLTGDEGGDRLAVYVDLLFHRPVAFATRRGLRRIRAGLEAETPKGSRGAIFRDLHGGVLDRERTRTLAKRRGPGGSA